MFPTVSPTTTNAWKALAQHHQQMAGTHLRELFRQDPQRFEKFSLALEDILFDYSKNLITEETLRLLGGLANECKLKDAIEAMFNGEKINRTENRAVLHTALRNCFDKPVMVDGKDVMPEIRKVLDQMKQFSQAVHSGQWKGYSGKKIRSIVTNGEHY